MEIDLTRLRVRKVGDIIQKGDVVLFGRTIVPVLPINGGLGWYFVGRQITEDMAGDVLYLEDYDG